MFQLVNPCPSGFCLQDNNGNMIAFSLAEEDQFRSELVNIQVAKLVKEQMEHPSLKGVEELYSKIMELETQVCELQVLRATEHFFAAFATKFEP